MPAISPTSWDATIRHAALLERLKAGQAKELLPFFREIDEALRLRLGKGELTAYSRARLEKLLGAVDENIDGILKRFMSMNRTDLKALAAAEASFEGKSLTEAVGNELFESTIPAPKQVWASVQAAPLSVRGIHGGKLLETFIKDWSTSQKALLVGRIRSGVFEGETNGQILRGIRGSVGGKFRDGILGQSYRQSEAMVRTAVQHTSNLARMATLEANSDLVDSYQWVSTLDSRTSEICQGLSNEVFPVGEGPVPPAHINCRSTIVPVLDEKFDFLKEGRTQAGQFGPVDANESYFSWIKQQPAAFQDSVLGSAKGKLLRDGGLSAEAFQKLTRSSAYKPLTLAQMEKLRPLAFKRAGIRITESGRAVLPRTKPTPPRSAPPAAPPPPAQPAPVPPPAPTPAARPRSTSATVGSVTKPPEPWNLGGSKANLTNASLTKVLKDLGTPEASALVEFLNKSTVGMVYGSPTKFGSRSWRLRTNKLEGKQAWNDYKKKVGPAPDGRTMFMTEPWAKGIESAGGFTAKSRNYVVLIDHAKAGGGLSNMANLDVKQLREKLRGSLKRVDRPKYNPDSGRMPSLEDKAYTLAHDAARVYGLGEDADTFLKWVHEIGHQVDYRMRYTAHRSGGNYWKAYDIPADAVRVSGYAHANDLEWFAETFCAWVVDRQALLAIDPRAVKIIDDAVAAALKFEPTP